MEDNNGYDNPWYTNREKLFVAVDCIIFGFDRGVLKLLVFERDIEPLKGVWSLIGSFIREDEDASEAARRVLKETTGLGSIYMEELKTYSSIHRDPGARCVCIAQYALIRINDQNNELLDQYNAKWFSIDALPELVIDHGQMVRDAFESLRNKARFFPVGFELLPKDFTIPQLQLLYEEIFQKKFDSRNFRKKILSLNILKKTTKKDKSSSKKGAFLYQFDSKKYSKLKREGFSFPLFRN